MLHLFVKYLGGNIFVGIHENRDFLAFTVHVNTCFIYLFIFKGVTSLSGKDLKYSTKYAFSLFVN